MELQEGFFSSFWRLEEDSIEGGLLLFDGVLEGAYTKWGPTVF
jgi:hypothetical protein